MTSGGPDASGVDGFWLELTDTYWGFLATITETGNQVGDTDCQFYAPDASTVVGEANNGGESCTGVVPDGTGWMFLYSYAEPSTGMTLEFTVQSTPTGMGSPSISPSAESGGATTHSATVAVEGAASRRPCRGHE